MNEKMRSEIHSLVRSYLQANADRPHLPLRDFIRDFERQTIETALMWSGGRQNLAAQLLRMQNSTLSEKIKRYGIRVVPLVSDQFRRWLLQVPERIREDAGGPPPG